MRGVIILLAVCIAAIAGKATDGHYKSQRIVGGIVTTINQYPYAAALLNWKWWAGGYLQDCGGTILTTTAVLSAAHCFVGDSASEWRIRVGSTYANSGGTQHSVRSIVIHPNYNLQTFDNDVSILRTTDQIVYISQVVAAGSIAGANYNLADNQPVWAIGWGATSTNGPLSEQLRHVQVWTINQAVCASRYAQGGMTITGNMLCSGWLDFGGRDQCQGDSGGPLLHNNIVVGICSWGFGCGDPIFPGVNTRVSRYTDWILANAS